MGFLTSLAAAILDPSRENMNRFKGEKGEAQAALGLLLCLPSEYTVVNNLLLPMPQGTTQIDHVVVSNYGVFVIESKNISGTIYGSAEDKYWTVCRGPSKFRLYNPLRQNATHIRALAGATGLPVRFFHSLVFFWSDNCRFKTPIPSNVLQTGLCGYIKSHRRFLLSSEDVRMAIHAIEETKLATTRANAEAHIASLNKMICDLDSRV